MNQIIEYIIQHFAWIIIGIILILLAVIGYYADKTNFGQSKKEKNDNPKYLDDNIQKSVDMSLDVEKNTLVDENINLNEVEKMTEFELDNSNEVFLDAVQEKLSNKQDEIIDLKDELKDEPKSEPKDNIDHIDMQIEEPKNNRFAATEAAFDNFEKEFEALLPKKNIITEDLLSDIDELELGKTQKIRLNEVPDLDDIELPKIKNFVSDEQDIWKF